MCGLDCKKEGHRMGFISPLIGCTLMLVSFVMGAVPPNMLTTVFNIQYVKPNSIAKERCQAGGDPQPTYIWKKNGNVLTSDSHYTINQNTGEIEIKSVTVLNGEGTYQCFAQNSMGTALSGFWEVRIASLIAFEQAKISTSLVNEYSYYSMPCVHQPSSMPSSKLDWLVGAGDNSAFPMSTEDKQRTVIDADGTLHFLYLRATDSSNNPYRCQLFNNIIDIKAVSLEIFNLNVLPVPEVMSKPILKYSKSVEGIIGSKATLLCIFAGYPIPEVEWLKDGARLPEANSRSIKDPDDSKGRKLIISRLEINDEGYYICRATNTLGTNEGTVKVKITGAPQWTKGPLQSIRIPVGATAKFQCDTVSHHATSSFPMWMTNGKPIIGCGMKKFWCGTGTKCYDYHMECDFANDCPGLPSAHNCPTWETCGEGRRFSCGGGECKTAADVVICDGIPQCANGGDESVRQCGCKVSTDFMCPDKKQCISASERCNKNAECNGGLDEINCAYDPEKVIDNRFHFSADLKQLTVPNVEKTDTMCIQCLVYNYREYGPNPKPDVVGITFGDATLTVLDPINILSGFPDKRKKVQPGDVFNFTILAKTDPLDQGNLRYEWYIGGKRYPEQFPMGKWSEIIQLSMDNMHINIDTNKIHSQDAGLFQELMGNLSVRVYHDYDQRTISTELFIEVHVTVPTNTVVPNLYAIIIAGVVGVAIVLILGIWYRNYQNKPNMSPSTNCEELVYNCPDQGQHGDYSTIDDERLYSILSRVTSDVSREASYIHPF